VFEGENGFLHRPADSDDLAVKVDLLALNPEVRRTMGTQSRVLVEKRFNWTSIAAHYLARYRKLLS
jgi:glycosyltransferase involved in cell wall biosynthesis